MPSTLYYQWAAAGRPITPAEPIREFVTKMQAAFPAHANAFGWYADPSHYEASFPEDHTPYSADAWPLPNPRWVVFATDVMNTAVGGADENERLFRYWLAEAKAGRMPWLKYLIWQATIYDVRYGWRPQPSADHYDHVHLSARTDYANASIGAWSPIPGAPTTTEETMRFVFSKAVGGDGRRVYVTDGTRYRIQPLAADVDQWLTAAGAGPVITVDHKPAASWSFEMLVGALCGAPLVDEAAAIAGLTATVDAQTALITALAETVKAGGGNVDIAAVMTAIADLRTGVESDVRDALADEAEGGAAAVRADQP